MLNKTKVDNFKVIFNFDDWNWSNYNPIHISNHWAISWQNITGFVFAIPCNHNILYFNIHTIHLCFNEHKSRYERFLFRINQFSGSDKMQEMKRLLDIVWSFSSKGKPIISGFGEKYLNSVRGREIYKIYSTQICPTIGLIYLTVASVAQQDCLR